MVNVGPMELIIVLVIALLVLGPEALARGRPRRRQGHARVQGLAERRSRHDDDEDDGEPATIRDGTTSSHS